MDVDEVVTRLKRVLPASGAPLSLHEPLFSGREKDYVLECLDTGWVSSAGRFVDLFEKRLAEYTGVGWAVAVVNGTAALHICLVLAGVEAGDEVLMPTLTFVATANAVSYLGAVPHFVDSEEQTLGLDPAKLADYLRDVAEVRGEECFNRHTGRRLRAVVPMHTFGHPVDLGPLLELCDAYHLVLIEDAAESLGSYYRGKHTGRWGRAAALSFNGNKIITTGGGGAVLTDDETLGRWAKHLTTTAKLPHRWSYVHDQVGYNYRLPNLNAALGCAQLERLPGLLQQKRTLADRYVEAFRDFEGARVFTEPAFALSNYWLNVLLLDPASAPLRDALLDASHKAGFMTRPVWTPMHQLPMYREAPRMDLSTAESLSQRIINLPSSPQLVDGVVDGGVVDSAIHRDAPA